MKAFLGAILVIIGAIGLYTSGIIWFAHFIYQLMTTDIGFFSAVFTNIVGLVLQVVVSTIVAATGSVLIK